MRLFKIHLSVYPKDKKNLQPGLVYICENEQALRISCELHCIQGHETACKLMKMHVSSWKCMQAD